MSDLDNGSPLAEMLKTNNWFTYSKFYDWVVQNHALHKVVEVGCWKGHSTAYLAHKLLEAGRPFEFFAVDLWENLPKNNPLWASHAEEIEVLHDLYTTNLLNAGVRGHVFDVVGDSAESAKLFEDGSLDFVFIDAAHDEKSVNKDIRAWKRKVKPGGIIAGHDASSEGVRAAVEKNFDTAKSFDGDVWYTTV